MKKVFFLLLTVSTTTVVFAENQEKQNPKRSIVVAQNKITSPLVCSIGTVTLSSDESVVCVACGCSTGGSRGTDARVADCLMDALAQQ